jgi:hypothetical protein
LGVAYTDKVDGSNYNRVADVDGRLVFGRIYNAQFQLAASRTQRGAALLDGPLWNAQIARNGRRLNVNYRLEGIDPDFRTESGFISRPGVVNGRLDHRVTFFGPAGALVENITVGPTVSGTWQYRRFTRRGDMQDKKLHLNSNGQLRGGWQVGASVLIESFGYDPQLYAGYAIERGLPGGGADTVPFTGTPRIPNLDYVISLGTPQFKRFSADGRVIWGRDENFFEWASSDILFVERPIFVRVVGQYDSNRQDALRDDSRTGFPLLVYDAALRDYARAGPAANRQFRADYLFSYQPNPGTVVFAGYGSTMNDPFALDRARSQLERASDGFFLKASYLFRRGRSPRCRPAVRGRVAGTRPRPYAVRLAPSSRSVPWGLAAFSGSSSSTSSTGRKARTACSRSGIRCRTWRSSTARSSPCASRSSRCSSTRGRWPTSSCPGSTRSRRGRCRCSRTCATGTSCSRARSRAMSTSSPRGCRRRSGGERPPRSPSATRTSAWCGCAASGCTATAWPIRCPSTRS